MSPQRAPMAPPELPGYLFQRVLGSGGYSDVFLYEQQMPRRSVAVKVLLAEALDVAGRQQFTDEANAMAAVSTHPFIVTIFHAEVGSAGNAYLVMEFYPRPNYSVRARTEQLSVAEVLRTGVQVASAVETAHRAGILHRDIKPANILTSEYGRPGLTDFGIASTAVDGVVAEAAGMSIPWSPPEVISGSGVGDHRADVYSLGATLYTLLAGRSPYEVTGGSNRSLDLIERIERSSLPPTGRGDVPASLERLLRQAMSKEPSDRPHSAAAFARALQEIEVEQHFGMTQLEVRDDNVDVRSRGEETDDGTRLKGPVVIRSQPTTGPRTGRTSDGQPGELTGASETVQRVDGSDGLIRGIGQTPSVGHRIGGPHVPPGVATDPGLTSARRVETSSSTPESSDTVAPTTRSRATVIAAALLVIAVALVVTRLAMGESTEEPTDDDGPTTTVTIPTRPPSMPPTPTDVTLSGLTVAWSSPAPEAGDIYRVTDQDGNELGITEDGATQLQLESAPTCVKVTAIRNGRPSADSTCVKEGNVP